MEMDEEEKAEEAQKAEDFKRLQEEVAAAKPKGTVRAGPPQIERYVEELLVGNNLEMYNRNVLKVIFQSPPCPILLHTQESNKKGMYCTFREQGKVQTYSKYCLIFPMNGSEFLHFMQTNEHNIFKLDLKDSVVMVVLSAGLWHRI